MRISDWSSDVCSSDLEAQVHRRRIHQCVRGRSEEARRRRLPGTGHPLPRRDRKRVLHRRPERDDQKPPKCRRPHRTPEHERSEERREGNESVSTSKSRWAWFTEKRKYNNKL